MPFNNRTEAGEQLALALERYRNWDAIVLALPRGGLPVAVPIARYLEAPLDILLVRKIGVPFNPEVAMGAVVETDPPIVVRNEETIRLAAIEPEVFDTSKEKELRALKRRARLYRGSRRLPTVRGKTIILVDDGIATGATVRAALAGLNRLQPGMVVLAVPVAPRQLIESLSKQADDFVCLEELGRFGAISLHYDQFDQLSDEDVAAIMDRPPR